MRATGALVLVLLAGCTSPLPGVEAPPIASDPAAAALVERWFAQSFAFDALQAFEVVVSEGSVGFALARKWSGRSLKLLAWVVEPDSQNDTAFLILQEPGKVPDVFVYSRLQGYPGTSRRVIRAPFTPNALRVGSTTSLSTEVVSPPRIDEFAHRTAGRETIGEEACLRIESRPLQRRRFLTHVIRCISETRAVALWTVYLNGDEELRRVDVLPEDVREYESGWLPVRLAVRTADGQRGEIWVRNVMLDVALDDHLFTRHNLRVQRFPSF